MSRQLIQIQVVHGDALTFEADILALKYARGWYGVDAMVSARLEKAGVEIETSPEIGEAHLLDSRGSVAARCVLFLGVERLQGFRYREIREFGRAVLSELARLASRTTTIALTVHGPGYGLDEGEALRSEIAGLIDGLTGGTYPPNLETISVVELDAERAAAITAVLRELVPHGTVEAHPTRHLSSLSALARENLRSAGFESAAKPHVFVAMPFHKAMLDIYRYGIERPVNDSGYLCERADQAVFTGDILQWLKDRIATSELVIADLSGANPNVYLEVGYAWGLKKRTVLLANAADDVKFDVQGQKCLKYETISELEEKLRSELAGLKA
ncbi:MAG TPA: hypothetical protein VEX86_26345 [Longimicrobium sp.]|nr:hypothetical protein [Longimicrobium sp.]